MVLLHFVVFSTNSWPDSDLSSLDHVRGPRHTKHENQNIH